MDRNIHAVDKAIRDVRSGFPFPRILEDSEDTIRALARVLQEFVPSGGRLLDIGCGALDKASVFQKIGYECFACDDFSDPWHSQQNNLDPVLEYAAGLGIQVQSLREDYSIPWEVGSFDVVCLINVIEHLHESPRDILNFAGAYLKEDGVLLVVMPNSVNLRKRLSVLSGKSNYTPARGLFENEGAWRGHVREYTLQETGQIVQWAGFKVARQRTFHGMVKQRLHSPLFRLAFGGVCTLVPSFRDSLLVAAHKPADWKPRQPDPEAGDRSLSESWV